MAPLEATVNQLREKTLPSIAIQDSAVTDQSGRIAPNMRALAILEVLGQQGRAMTPTEIGHILGLPKQTAHRLCKSLVREGYLARDGHSKHLRPSRRARHIAAGILHASRTHIARHQVLIDVASHVGETVNFVGPEDAGMIYLDRVETDWPFRVQLPVGTHVPFHCTASGKTFLASLPGRARQAMVASLPLDRLTANTLTTPQALLDELDEIRRRGYALDNEEFYDDMVALAVPVLDPQGRYCASLAFHGPLPRLTLDKAIAEAGFLKAAAARLSQAIFS